VAGPRATPVWFASEQGRGGGGYSSFFLARVWRRANSFMGSRILAEGEATTALRVSRYCMSVAFWFSFEAASLRSLSAFGAEDGGLSLALCLEDRRLLLALCLQCYGLSLAVGLGIHGPPLPLGGYLPAGRSPD
jgi:hypothetical protein